LPFTAGEIERLVAYQIGAANALATYAGARLGHVKIHGALSNIAAEDETVALAIARAVKLVEPGLGFLAPAGTKLETAGLAQGLAVAREIYADRAYTDAGLLVERSCPGAVLHDAGDAAERVLAMILEGAIITISGKRLAAGIDSICVHGDSPNAVAMAKAVRARLEKTGIALAPFVAV
jgi:5-oxoprolinase (ATP-hydrolysing) subunit A